MERAAPSAWARWKYLVGIPACALFGWIAFYRKGQIPLLSLVDLGFHELGHLVTVWLPEVLYFAAGSAAQIAVPLGLAVYFLVRRDHFAGALCLAWGATSAKDVAVYIADAPTQLLPLIGGEHDWAVILGPEHLHALDEAGAIALAVRSFGLALLFAAFAICAWHVVMDDEVPEGAGPSEAMIDTPERRGSLPSRVL